MAVYILDNSEELGEKAADLIAKNAIEKQVNFRRIAYQIPEDPKTNICARSYEDALILANLNNFHYQVKTMLLQKLGNMRRDLLKRISL